MKLLGKHEMSSRMVIARVPLVVVGLAIVGLPILLNSSFWI